MRRHALIRLAGVVAVIVGARLVAAQPARTPVVGSVRDVENGRLAGATVELLTRGNASAQRTSTNDDGAFRFGDVAAGTVMLRVRRLGFRPDSLEIDVPQIAGGGVVVLLERVVQALPAAVVRGRGGNATATGRSGFDRRREAGLGRFLTHADIERRRPQRTTDLFRAMAGVVLEEGDGGVMIPHFRDSRIGNRRCNPYFWLDGSPLGAMPLDLDAISPGSLEAVEAYSGVATVPAALRPPIAAGACGVIAVWTRQGGRATGVAAVSSAELATLVESGEVFTADQVDRPAASLPMTPFTPAYPDSLRKVAGRVVVEFVVDRDGSVESETIGVVSSNRSAFTSAVRAALPQVRFSPAVRKGQTVRQVVQWPVKFEPPNEAVP